jgi:hypothetical protein
MMNACLPTEDIKYQPLVNRKRLEPHALGLLVPSFDAQLLC